MGNIILMLISSFMTLGVLEGAIRYFHSSKHEMTFTYDIEEEIYRSLSIIKKEYNEQDINILLLGGSVLDDIVPRFRETYQENKKIKIYDMAAAAHSTRDSKLKLEYLTRKGFKFDHIIFYHGVNDARANNVPPEMFKENYDHYFFYSQINPAFNLENKVLRLFLKSAIFIKAYQSFFYYVFKDDEGRFVPAHNPREKWLRYGHDLKSVKSFSENLSSIIKNATSTDSKLIIPRFATFLPENYDQLKHKNNQLGYAQIDGSSKYFLIVDAWGKFKNVKKAVHEHNKIIKNFSDRFQYIDTTSFDENGKLFVDPCHFSSDGINLFVSSLKRHLKINVNN